MQGRTTPDAVRVSAARCLIRYQRAEQRAPLKGPTPTQLEKKAALNLEKAKLSEFEENVAKIKRKLKTGGDSQYGD